MEIRLFKKQGFWSILDQAILSGSNFLTVAILFRWLSKSEFGQYSIIHILILFFMSFQTALIISPFINFGSTKNGNDQDQYTSNVFSIQFFYSLLLFFFIPISIFLKGENQIDIKFILLSAVFINLKLIHELLRKYFYISKQTIKITVGDFCISFILISTLFFINQFHHNNLHNTLFAHIVSLSLPTAVLLYYSPINKESFKISLNALSLHWSYGKWLLAKAIVQWWSSNYFIIAAVIIYGDVAAGTIKSSQNIIGIISIFFLALENYVPIHAAQAYKNNQWEGLINYLKKITIKGGLVTIALSVFVIFFRDHILDLTYGSNDPEISKLLFWMALMPIVTFLGLPIRIALRTTNLTRPIFTSYLVSSVLSLLLAHPLIKHFGLNSVAFGMIGSQVIINALCFISIVKKYKNENY